MVIYNLLSSSGSGSTSSNIKRQMSGEGQMMVRWSGEHQVNLNLSLTLLDVKLVLIGGDHDGCVGNLPHEVRAQPLDSG